jgi:uncharacterized protein (DUF427 family)
MTMRAVWNGHEIARSDDTIAIEGNHYFPRDAVDAAVLRDSDKRTWCPWKGHASYFTLEVGGERNDAAAWYYADPKPKAEMIRDRVAFWRGVVVEPT